MKNFKLIESLLNPVDILSENTVINTNKGFEISIDEINFTSSPSNVGGDIEANVKVQITYAEDGNAEMYLTLDAVLKAEYATEDNSFDYTYGSIRGTHGGKYGAISDYQLQNVRVPRVEDNIELFKVDPEKMKEIIARINTTISATDSDEIQKNINAEAFQKKVETMLANDNGYD
jgi:hypothetical protein